MQREPNHTTSFPYQMAGSITTSELTRTNISFEAPSGPRRIGIWLRFLICLSLAMILAVLAFISWAWFESPNNLAWRRMVLGLYLTQSVTLVGVIVRTATGILSATATSMIASLAVERKGVHLKDVAAMSIARFSNSGPLSLSGYIASRSALEPLLHILSALLLLTTIVSQFTSALLVSDLAPGQVVSLYEKVTSAYGFDSPSDVIGSSEPPSLEGFSYNPWTRRPSSSEIFAEYSEYVETADNIDDTGPTIRAFLPLPIQRERELLQEFRGMAQVVDSRVICLRPVVSNLRLCSTFYVDSVGVCGSLSINNIPDTIVFRENVTSTGFVCVLADASKPQYGWSLCNTRFGDMTTNLTNATTTGFGPSLMSMSYMLWNSGDVVKQLQGFPQRDGHLELIETSASGPWLHQRALFRDREGNAGGEANIKMSWCFGPSDSPPLAYLNITASSTQALSEPQYEWNQTGDTYSTTDVRRQLRAVADGRLLTNEERQVLTITPEDMRKELASIRGQQIQRGYQDHYDLLSNALRTTATDIHLSPYAAPDATGDQITDGILANLIHYTIEETNSPALALQAFKTVLKRMIYYDFISTFTSTSQDTVARFTTTPIPQSTVGYWVVVSTIVIHILLFSVINFLFLRTKFSLPNNAWHTVAQAAGSVEMKDLLVFSRLASDDQVDHWLEGTEPPRNAFESAKHAIRKMAGMFSTGQKKVLKDRYVVDGGAFVLATGSGSDSLAMESGRRTGYMQANTDDES